MASSILLKFLAPLPMLSPLVSEIPLELSYSQLAMPSMIPPQGSFFSTHYWRYKWILTLVCVICHYSLFNLPQIGQQLLTSILKNLIPSTRHQLLKPPLFLKKLLPSHTLQLLLITPRLLNQNDSLSNLQKSKTRLQLRMYELYVPIIVSLIKVT